MQFRIRFRDLLAIAASLAALSLCLPAAAQPAEAYSPPANAEESIDNVNILVGEYPDEDRAELVLLPAIAAMDAAPPDVSTPESAAMLAPGHPSWSAARSWSEADAQKAALDALMKVGEPRTRFVFALPFGDDALSSTLRETGLTARLADGKLLAGMQLRYLEGLDRLGALANVRATALADDGDVMSAMEVLMAWLRTARSLAARPFYREVEWSLSAMTHVIERMADVAYTYDDLAPDDVRDILWEVDDRGLQLDRILFPRGDREAALQLVAAVFEPRRGPDPTQFGPTLAGLETGERPLRRFGAAGRWQKIAQTHADWFDTVEELERIYEDWMIKWSFDPFDDLLKQPFEYELADDARFAALKEVLDDMSDLFQKRIALRTTLAGSRTSLAVVGFKVQNRRLPPNLFAIRGTESGFLRALPRDPFNPDERQPLKFFVPIRDQPSDIRADPRPHVISITPGDISTLSVGAGSALSQEAIDAIVSVLMERAGAREDARPIIEQTVRTAAENPRAVVGQFPPEVQDTTREWMQATLEALAAAEITVENAAEVAATLPETVTQGPQLPGSQRTAQSAEEREAVGLALARRMQDPAFAEAVQRAGAGEQLPDRELDELFYKDVQARYIAWGHVLTGAASAEEVAQTASQQAATSFTVALDDSTFVVYSVGPDGSADWARRVGQGGADILLWPPKMSLIREHQYEAAGWSR